MVIRSANFRPSSCWAGATSWWCFSGSHAELAHHRQHLAAQVLGGVDRVDREVAALGPGPVAHVAFRVVAWPLLIGSSVESNE